MHMVIISSLKIACDYDHVDDQLSKILCFINGDRVYFIISIQVFVEKWSEK